MGRGETAGNGKKMCVQRQLDCIRCGCGGVAGDIKKMVYVAQ